MVSDLGTHAAQHPANEAWFAGPGHRMVAQQRYQTSGTLCVIVKQSQLAALVGGNEEGVGVANPALSLAVCMVNRYPLTHLVIKGQLQLCQADHLAEATPGATTAHQAITKLKAQAAQSCCMQLHLLKHISSVQVILPVLTLQLESDTAEVGKPATCRISMQVSTAPQQGTAHCSKKR